MTVNVMKGTLKHVFEEVLICLKDVNKKSRDGAISILRLLIRTLQPGDMMAELSKALHEGTSSSIKSSATTGLCILIMTHRTSEVVLDRAVELLPSVGELLVDDCPHQKKAVLSFLRVFVSVQPPAVLDSLLPQIVTAFTQSLGTHKAKFSSRCRAIMRKLVQRIDEEALRTVVSPTDLPLLDYVCKYARRAQRKREIKDKQSRLDRMLGSDSDDDSDDGDDDEDRIDVDKGADDIDPDSALMKVSAAFQAPLNVEASTDYRLGSRPKAKRAGQSADIDRVWLPSSLEDLMEDQPSLNSRGAAVGMVGRKSIISTKSSVGAEVESPTHVIGKRSRGDYQASASRSSGSGSSNSNSRRDEDNDDTYQVIVTADGKVVVKEVEVESSTLEANDSSKQPLKQQQGDGRPSNSKNDKLQQSKRRKLHLNEPGVEYRSKKSGGDVWRKGMLEPHAYIPLDPRLLSKKHHREAVSHFGVVVKSKDGKKKREANRREDAKKKKNQHHHNNSSSRVGTAKMRHG